MTNRVVASIDHVVLLLLALSLTANVYLGLKVVRSMPPAAAPATLTIGSKPGPFDAQNLAGQQQSIRPEDVKVNTVLYIFSPNCSWCDKNLANLHALATAAGTQYRIIGVSLEPSVDTYIRTKQFVFPVLIRPSVKTKLRYHLGTTPQTIVLSPSGSVLKSWQGAYAGPIAEEVSKFFSVELPGLVSTPMP